MTPEDGSQGRVQASAEMSTTAKPARAVTELLGNKGIPPQAGGGEGGELKPCPFCGGKADDIEGVIGCDPCSVVISNATMWNRRSALSEPSKGRPASELEDDAYAPGGPLSGHAKPSPLPEREEVARVIREAALSGYAPEREHAFTAIEVEASLKFADAVLSLLSPARGDGDSR